MEKLNLLLPLLLALPLSAQERSRYELPAE
jgi:hypothetical protein